MKNSQTGSEKNTYVNTKTYSSRQMDKSDQNRILIDNAITSSDIFAFKWRIPQVLCEVPKSWGALTEVELLIRSALHAYENKELQQDFLKGKLQNVYKAIMEEIMEDLVIRGIAIKDEQSIAYEEGYISRYRKGSALTPEKCEQVLRYGRGHQELFDSLFPIL